MNPSSPPRKFWKLAKGFSLAELLIALLILGEIATFTIPKILSAQADSRKMAILKETLSALSAATYQNCLEPSQSSNPYQYLTSKINTVKQCPTNSATEGCWDPAAVSGDGIEPGFTMHNGASIAGIRNGNWTGDTFMVDYNGLEGPNLANTDQFQLIINLNSPTSLWGAQRCQVTIGSPSLQQLL